MIHPVWHPRKRSWFAGLAAATLVVTLAGCGGDEQSPGVATAGSRNAEPTASAASGAVAQYVEAQRQWVKCVREQGFDLPDPNAKGQVELSGPGAPKKTDPKWREASTACAKYSMEIPEELEEKPAPLTEEEIKGQRAYAKCMRESGVPNFPDPGPDGHWPQDNDNSGGPVMSEQEMAAQLRASVICEPVRKGQPKGTPGPLPSAKG
jgi:hypothetical protein